MNPADTNPPDAVRGTELLAILRERLTDAEQAFGTRCLEVPRERRASARNLVHAAALDALDTHALDTLTVELGLRAPADATPAVLHALDKAASACAALAGADHRAPRVPAPCDEREARTLHESAAELLLGPSVGSRIVATPSSADPDAFNAMLEGGMRVARLNTARLDPEDWQRLAELARGRCKILVTLAGPRMRTGSIEPGPGVCRVRPRRDALGGVTEPARLWLRPEDDPYEPPKGADGVLPLPPAFVASLRHGDHLQIEDARGRERTLVVVDGHGHRSGRWALSSRGMYVTTGLAVTLEHPAGREAEALIGHIEPVPQAITLAPGDRLFLTKSQAPGKPAERDSSGAIRSIARLACTLPGVLDDLTAGAPVLFDEGRLECRCLRTNEAGAELEVVRTRRPAERLGADRPIHLPGASPSVPLLSERDERAVEFAAVHGDMLGVPFCRDAEDLDLIETRVRQALPTGRPMPGVVLTLETSRSVDTLDGALLAALRWPAVGVLLSRGELAVEVGVAQLSIVESRVRRLAAAAHAPLLYSTPALQSLVRRGRPGRSEPGDQSALLRADAPVLGTGERAVEAVRWLAEHLRASHDAAHASNQTRDPIDH